MTDMTVLIGLPYSGTVVEISSVELVMDTDPHPFYSAEKDSIQRNWLQEVAANPALFNGKLLLHREIHLENGHLKAVSHLVPFSTFMWWRKQPERLGAAHLFAVAAIVSSDGALIAVKMGDHTANPGKVYCAAGSLDHHDIVGNRVDFEANMRREVAEETGLDLRNAKPIDQLYGLWRDRAFTIFRYFRFEETAQQLLNLIKKHMVEDHEKEIAGPVAIWSADPKAHDYGPFMPFILYHYFNHISPGEK